MLDTALLLLETAINQAIKTDLQTLARLQELTGKKIKCDITDWNIVFFVIPQHHGVELQAHLSGTVDTVIMGKLHDLIQVGLSDNKADAMRKHRIQFSGDAHTGIALQQLFNQLDIDWEEHLARLVGDTPATLLSKGFRGIINTGKTFIGNLKRNTEEYIHHEKNLCPTRHDLESFYNDIAQLRNDVDRLEAKWHIIKRSKENV